MLNEHEPGWTSLLSGKVRDTDLAALDELNLLLKCALGANDPGWHPGAKLKNLPCGGIVDMRREGEDAKV